MSEPIVIGDGGRRGNRRVKVLAGIAVAILLFTVVLPKVLGGGGDGTANDSFTPVTTSPDVGPETDGDAPRETFETFSSKNPFKPLVDLTPAADTAAPDTTATVETIPADTSITPDPSLEGGLAQIPSDDAGSTTTTVPPPPPRQPDRVSLLEVYTHQSNRPVASVRVNDVTYQVARGDEFATSYRVVSLDTRDRCAQLLYGDDSFVICEGEEVRK